MRVVVHHQDAPTVHPVYSAAGRGRLGFGLPDRRDRERYGALWPVPPLPARMRPPSASASPLQIASPSAGWIRDSLTPNSGVPSRKPASRRAGRMASGPPTQSSTASPMNSGPVDEEGSVLYPDAQIDYTDAEGRTERVNVKVVSG